MKMSEKLDVYKLHEFLNVHAFNDVPGIRLRMCSCGMLARGDRQIERKSSVHVSRKCVAAIKKMYGRDIYHCARKLYHLRRDWK